MHGCTLRAERAQGQGRISAALWEQGPALMKPESAERAEEWRGPAAQKSRPPAKLLRAAFSEHHPAKPSLVQRRKCSVLLFRVANPQLLPATAPHPPGQKKAFLQTRSARMSISKHALSTSPFTSSPTELTRGLANSINLRRLWYNPKAAVDFPPALRILPSQESERSSGKPAPAPNCSVCSF